MNKILVIFLAGFILASYVSAETITWTGGAGDGRWTTPGNWSGGAVPTIADDVTVGSNATVVGATSSFRSLHIQSGSKVIVTTKDANDNWYLRADSTLTVDGTLDFAKSGIVVRASKTIWNLNGALSRNVGWLDTGVGGKAIGSTMNFTDGASFENEKMSFQLALDDTFGFKLSPTGFKTLKAGILYGQFALKNMDQAHEGVDWSAITFNIDVSDYDIKNGAKITLFCFQGNDFNDPHQPFDPVVNITPGASGITGGTLAFDSVKNEITLTLRVTDP